MICRVSFSCSLCSRIASSNASCSVIPFLFKYRRITTLYTSPNLSSFRSEKTSLAQHIMSAVSTSSRFIVSCLRICIGRPFQLQIRSIYMMDKVPLYIYACTCTSPPRDMFGSHDARPPNPSLLKVLLIVGGETVEKEVTRLFETSGK